MRIIFSLSFSFCFFLSAFTQGSKQFELLSPDKKIKISANAIIDLQWSVKHENTEVIWPSPISIELASGEILGRKVQLKKASKTSVDQTIQTPIYKKQTIRDQYNQLFIQFKDGWGIYFRAYNDGVAYRIVTNRKDSMLVRNEDARFQFAKDLKGYFPFVRDLRVKGDQYISSFEALYDEIPISAIPKDTLAFLPVMVDLGDGKKLVITESGLENYPGMYLKGGKDNSLTSSFAPYPTEEKIGGLNKLNAVVTQRADYIAKLPGNAELPWRVFVISSSDKDLLNNDMVYKLASPGKIGDVSWIKPGKVAWDWWNDWNITGVDFKAGINTQTYKYYIDFAAANQLEYIIMDEGWSASNDLFNLSKAVDLKEIIDYGKQKNVGVILWATWHASYAQMDSAFPHYASMGIKGFKIDFLDRDDQRMVASTFAIAKKAAENHLLVDYHGMFKPAGLQRTYPNVINFEGVKGLENVKWTPADDVPHYDVTIPFIRMLAGPMDYTPGAMRNANKGSFRAINSSPMSQGTRTHQLAMYIIFEAPLQMLADNPTAYKKEQESTDFISRIPTVFDETIALDGKVGEYVAIARRKGNEWYVGAMSNWNAREMNIDLSFLGEGNYEAEVFKDGVNADRDGTDYKRETIRVKNNERLKINLASGGGWAARIYKVN
ncbi:MAG: glycoside hydrolase family 97 protein [Flavisolibacter sp.]